MMKFFFLSFPGDGFNTPEGPTPNVFLNQTTMATRLATQEE
jgi:hypothetical protein